MDFLLARGPLSIDFVESRGKDKTFGAEGKTDAHSEGQRWSTQRLQVFVVVATYQFRNILQLGLMW